jgi:DNA-binding MarR family transcriptional regulator
VQLPPGVSGSSVSPDLLNHLPAAIRSGYVHAYAASLQNVFLVAVPIAVVAFLLTWILPEIELRRTTGAVDPGETFAMPEDRSSIDEVERALTVLARRESRPDLYQRLAARAGVGLPPKACWLLYRFEDHADHTLEELAGRIRVPVDRLFPPAEELRSAGMLSVPRHGDQGGLALTDAGRAALDRLTEARRAGLADLLGDWSPDEHPEIAERLTELARALLADDDRMLADAQRGRSPGAVAAAP